MTKTLLYARVSTDKQELQNQLLDLRRLAARKNYKIVGEIIEERSGRLTNRAGLRHVLDRNDYDVLLVWSLDRLTREGIFPTIQLLQNLKGKGVKVEFVKDSVLNTLDNELVFYIMLTVLSALAKSEREKISERTKAGLRRARAAGKKLGRPPRPISPARKQNIIQFRNAGASIRAIGRKVKLPHSTVQLILSANSRSAPPAPPPPASAGKTLYKKGVHKIRS